MTYLGFDESSLSIGNGGLIVVGVVTHNPELARCGKWNSLPKARDLLDETVAHSSRRVFPSLAELKETGLDSFSWLRVRSGRLTRQEMEHAVIAYLVKEQATEPEGTIVMIDAYDQPTRTVDRIAGYLDMMSFPIPPKNIQVHEGGDRSVPIINYADVIALMIVERIERTYEQFFERSYIHPIAGEPLLFENHRKRPREHLERLLA